MTAPALPVAPTAAPLPITQQGVYGVDDAIAQISNEAIAQTLAEQTPAPDPIPPPHPEREDGAGWNAKAGRWQKQDGTFAVGTAPEADGKTIQLPVDGEPAPEGAPEAEPLPVELPEGFIAVPKAEGRELATTFQVFDHEGNELDIPDLRIKMTANGKLRDEPLDKVVRLAQYGVYNEEQQQKYRAVEQDSTDTKQQNQQVIQAFQRLQNEYERVMSDDTAYLQARARYEQQNTPEARQQAFQEQQTNERNKLAFDQAAFEGQKFLSSELQPAVQQIAGKLTNLSAEEIGARVLLATDHLRLHTQFGSIIPPNQYAQVRQILLSEVVPWAAQLHDHRETENQSRTTRSTTADKSALATARKATETAQVEAQRAKNLVGKAARPGANGSRGVPADNQPKPKANPSVDDAEQDAIRATLAAVGA